MPSESTAYLESDDVVGVTGVLASAGVLRNSEVVESLAIAGPGNMNLVLRVNTNQRSFIAKQSRPFVQKYPSIPAPRNRLLAEIDFYQFVEGIPKVGELMPAILNFDRRLHLMVLEDLGASADYGHVYASQTSSDLPIREAAQWLSRLHCESAKRLAESDHSQSFGSIELRRLNHQHIFEIPFQLDPALELDRITPGLSKIAANVVADQDLLSTIDELGATYLHPNGGGLSNLSLLHGDFYPGSWLHTCDGLRVIDAEFCFVGPPEFDLGVFAAHVRLAGGDDSCVARVLDEYTETTGAVTANAAGFQRDLLDRFSGVEILRRVLGVAQLPLPNELPLKQQMIDDAVNLLG